MRAFVFQKPGDAGKDKSEKVQRVQLLISVSYIKGIYRKYDLCVWS